MVQYIKLLLFAWLIGQCMTREVNSAHSQIKNVDVLGFPTAIDVLEVEFDEPLLLAKTYGACRNRTCASVPSCICDYTSADVCSGNAPQGCSCPVGLTCSINTTLQLGVPFSDYVAPGETNNYKIYIGPQNACKFIHFSLVTENGDPDIYVGTAATFDAGGALGTSDGLPLVQGKYGPESMILCPSDFSSFELGTLVVGVYSFPSGNIAQGVGAKVTVTVTVHDIPPAITPLACTPENANHTCIVDDEWVVEKNITQTKYYEMALPNECTGISFMTGIETFIGFSYKPFPQLKFESDIFTGGMETGGTVQRGAFMICAQDLGIDKLYIAANASRTTSKGFSFIVSTNPGWFHTQSIDSFNNFQYPFEMLSAAYMTCPNNQSFTCMERLTNGGDCYYFWFVNPVADPAPFYPRPFFTRGIPNINGIELSDKPSNPLANKFVAVVMLNLTVSLKNQFRIAEADLKDCQMKFSGRLLWSSNKQPVQETISFTPGPTECDFEELDALVPRMSKLLADQETVTTGLELSNIRYQLDTYAAGRNIYNCKQFALGLASTTVTNVTVDTKACLVTSTSPLFATDPCCNTSIGWTGENCNSRSQTVALQVFSSLTSATDQCYAPRCLSTFAQDFAKKSLTVANTLVGCSSNTPNALNFRADLYEPYQRCKEDMFGVLPERGFACWSDSDCENSAKCDLVHHKCLYPMSDRIDLFLRCFLDDIDPFIRDYIEKDSGIQAVVNVGEEANYQQWKTAFTVNDCTSEYDLAIKYRHRWKLIPSFSTFKCPLCPEYACLDKSCTVPFECNNIGSSCGKVWQTFPAQSCNLLQYCNWIPCEDVSTNTNSTCKTSCLDPGQSTNFCGVCENGQDCAELTSITTEPDCTSAQACVNHDGSVIAVNSEAECSNSLSCSVTCFDGTNDVPCADEGSCTAAGVCDGDYYVGDGACVTPLNPYNTPACKSPSWAQPYGCVDTTTDQTTCEGNGGVWRKKARTEDECNAFGFGCTERRIVSSWNNRYFITMKGPDACAAVGGVYGPILKWRPGTYQGGTLRTPTWQARAYTNRYTSAPTFDFFNLNEGINAAVNVKYSYNLKTENQCMYAQQAQLLDLVTCGCNPSGQLSEQCFSDFDASITDALTIVCQDVSGSISDVDTKIAVTYGNSSLDSSSLCISLKTGFTSVEKFKFSTLNAISTFLINFNSKEDYTFVNTNNAVVGGFIGDGISFDFEGGTLTDFTICAPMADNSISADSERFPVLDFALVDIGTNNVTPLEVEVTETQGKVCGTIAQLTSKNATNSYAYFPIARQASYATAKRAVSFLDHELALIIICIILYAFCAAFTLAKAIMIMRLGKWTQLTYVVLLILCGLCIVRLLFFLLTVGGAVLSAGDYVIIELPSFLYFSALSFFVIIWMFVARVIKRPNVSRNRVNQTITRYVIITNAVIYTIFILLIILYETLKQDIPVCGGRLQNFDLNTRQQIAYTYRLFVSAISLILGLGFIIYGFTVYSNMLSSSARGEKGKSRISGRKRVFWTTFICSVGLLCQCAFLLALLFSNYQNNTLAMGLLIAVEVIPITIVAAVTKTKDSEASYGTTTSPNTSGTKGAKMSTVKNSAISVRSDRMDDDTSKTTTADVPGARDPVASAATDNSKAEVHTGDTNDEDSDSDNNRYPSSPNEDSSSDRDSTTTSESESEASKPSEVTTEAAPRVEASPPADPVAQPQEEVDSEQDSDSEDSESSSEQNSD